MADRLGRDFLDSDDQVEARTGRTVREIFEADGEDAFRVLEAEALSAALDRPEPVVVAAAGGVVLNPDNRRRLRRAGTVVWLHAEPAVLARRVGGSDHRPLLGDDPAGVLARMERERAALYREVADHVVDVGQRGPDEAAEAVLALVDR
ncbi:MAG: shikimate kinase [Actinomycetota bacterium]|nr:shikimate kinase [Actinomycetota bacterium]